MRLLLSGLASCVRSLSFGFAVILLAGCGIVKVTPGWNEPPDPEITKRSGELKARAREFDSYPLDRDGLLKQTLRTGPWKSSAIGPIGTSDKSESRYDHDKQRIISFRWRDTLRNTEIEVTLRDTSRWSQLGMASASKREAALFQVIVAGDTARFPPHAAGQARFQGRPLRLPLVEGYMDGTFKKGYAVVREDSLIAWVELLPKARLWIARREAQALKAFVSAFCSALLYRDEDGF